MSAAPAIARAYARALLQLATSQGEAEAWMHRLDWLAQVFAVPDMALLAASPKVERGLVLEFLIALGGDVLNSEGRNFLKLLSRGRRLALLPEIAQRFREVWQQREGLARARIVSAQPLTDSHRRQIAEFLESVFQQRIDIDATTDASLMAGVRIQVRDRVLDGSLKGRLDDLSRRLS